MAVDLQAFEPTYQLSEHGGQVVSRLKTPFRRAGFSVQADRA
jgi:hypothetical protein